MFFFMSLNIRHICDIFLCIFSGCIIQKCCVCTLVCTADSCRYMRDTCMNFEVDFTVFKIVFYENWIMLGIKFITKTGFFLKAPMLIQNLTHDRPLPKQIGLLTFRDIRFLHLRSVQSIVNYSVLTQAVLRINLVKMSRSQVYIFIISSLYYLENFNADVAIMIKMWDIHVQINE